MIFENFHFFPAQKPQNTYHFGGPRPREYDRTTSRIEMVLPGSRVVQFHGLGPDF